MSLLQREQTLELAAAKAGMTRVTARRYRDLGQLPSGCRTEHSWRTRADPFAEVWEWVASQLSASPALEAKTLFEALQREHPGRFADSQLRTLQRRVKQWRAVEGPAREAFFQQVHYPGRLCQSDFTHMSKLGVTIAGRSFEHLLYHFVLTYSNWETCTLCYSESFESLSQGLQNALWELGGVPQWHRSDQLSAAVCNTGNREEFTRRYQGLLSHYGLEAQATNAGHGNENGDVEQRHHRFKRAVDQALMLRGSRDFADLGQYLQFLKQLNDRLNAGRQVRLAEELKLLRPLPATRLETAKRLMVRVDRGSLIHVDRNAYSVNSRLIGQKVQVRQYVEHLEVWSGQKKVEQLPRLRGRGQHRVNYRHIIDWLVRKPGAFADYRYQSDLFPSSLFRAAYDQLRRLNAAGADRQYVKILYLAASQSEASVEAAIERLLEQGQPLSFEQVEALVRCVPPREALSAGQVLAVDLSGYDQFLEGSTVTAAAPLEAQP